MKNHMMQVIDRIRKDIMAYWGIAAVIVGVYAVCHIVFQAFCPMIIITGLPCPGCGITRGILFLLSGQILRSLRVNPMAVFWLLFFLYCAWQRYIKGRPIRGGKQCVIILIAAMVMIYLYRMVVYFPDRPPMVYTSPNLFEKVIPGYRFAVETMLH